MTRAQRVIGRVSVHCLTQARTEEKLSGRPPEAPRGYLHLGDYNAPRESKR